MKIIDLLNKIANDEELPKRFVYEGDEFHLSNDKCYRCDERGIIFEEVFIFEDLNNEIEIIEEKKIPEKIKIEGKSITIKGTTFFKDKDVELFQKLSMEINEIIDYLKSKGE